MTRWILFHLDQRQVEPPSSVVRVAQPRMGHGQEDMVEGGAPVTQGGGLVEAGDRGPEIAGTIVGHPQGIPVGAALGIPLDRLGGQCYGAGRVADGRIRRAGQQPGQVIGEVAPTPAERRMLGMDRQQPGQEVEGMLPGGLRLAEFTAILRGASQGLIASRQVVAGSQGPGGDRDGCLVTGRRSPCATRRRELMPPA